MRDRRLVPLIVLAVVLAAFAVADRQLDRPASPAPGLAAVAPDMAVLPPAAAFSAAWYCPGGPLGSLGEADVTLALANAGAAPVDARVRVLTQAGSATESKEQPVTIPSHGTTTVRLADIVGRTTPAGASVVALGGSVAVSQSIKTPEGQATAACASGASERWYTAAGSTAAGTSLYLALLNPFPGEAIVDLAFSTDQGRSIPVDLQGVVVPSRSLVVLDVGDKVRRRDAVGAEVTVREGRLVVGRNYRKGTASSTSVAAPSVGATSWFANGIRADGLASKLYFTNPGEDDAEVLVELRLDEGAVEPFTVAVPAQDRAELSLDDSRIPKGVPYALTVRSDNDVPVVVERSVDSRAGRTDVLGARVGALRWLVQSPGPRGADTLAVLSTADRDATVRFLVLDGTGREIAGSTTTVAPGARIVQKLDDRIGSRATAVVVESDAEVVVERDAGDTGPTLGALIGIPDIR